MIRANWCPPLPNLWLERSGAHHCFYMLERSGALHWPIQLEFLILARNSFKLNLAASNHWILISRHFFALVFRVNIDCTLYLVRHSRQTVWEQGKSFGVCSWPSYIPVIKIRLFSWGVKQYFWIFAGGGGEGGGMSSRILWTSIGSRLLALLDLVPVLISLEKL